MGSIERYCGQRAEAKLKALCKTRDEAVAAVAAEVQRQADLNRRQVRTTRTTPSATTGVGSYSYSISYNPSVKATPRAITPAARDAELRKIREKFERDRQLTILQARVMSQWQDL